MEQIRYSFDKSKYLTPFEETNQPQQNLGFLEAIVGGAIVGGNFSNQEEIEQAVHRAIEAGGEGNEPQDTYHEQDLNYSRTEVVMRRHTQSQNRKLGFFKQPKKLLEVKNQNPDLVEGLEIEANTITFQLKKTSMNDRKIFEKIYDLVDAVDGL